MQVYLANNIREDAVFRVGPANAADGASWNAAPPEVIPSQRSRPKPHEIQAKLPAGGSLAVSYKRTTVNQQSQNPQPQLHIRIKNTAGKIQVTQTPTHPALLNGSVQQSEGQVIITFKGQ